MEIKDLRKHFIETAYETLDEVVDPTPYLEITEGDKVSVKFLNGEGNLPSENTTEVTGLDLKFASLFFDFHLLDEGKTGVGKSYTADALGHMICSSDGYLNLTLSGGAMGTSAVEPFTKTVLDNGIPRIHIDPEKCEKYGILFLDEINAGDFKDTGRVAEGVAQVNGEIVPIQLPIPGTDRYKKISIIAAMNPADALHSHAQELSIAGENRFLKFRFPNGATEAPSSQPDVDISDDLHEIFWKALREKTGDKRGWREIFPLVTDQEQFPMELDGATKEFFDIALGYVGVDPAVTYNRNAKLIKQGGMRPSFSVRKDNNYKKALDAQKTLKHGFVRRDIKKIPNLSKLLGFIKGVKDRTYKTEVSLNDVAAAIGIILESKTVTGSDYGKLMTLVNDVRGAYAKLTIQLGVPQGYGIRPAIWQAAVNSGSKHGFEAYINALQMGYQQLNTQQQQNEGAANAVAKSRLLADLVVLENFSKEHERDVTAILKNGGDITSNFEGLYDTNKGKIGAVYKRIDSIVR